VAKKNKPTAGWQTNHSGKDTKAEDNGPSGWPGSGCERGLGRLDGWLAMTIGSSSGVQTPLR